MNPTMSAPEFSFAGASPATAKLDGRSVIESLKLTLLIDRSTGAVEEKQAIALHRDPLGSGQLRKGFAFHSNRTAKAHGRAPARHASPGPGSAADLQVNSPQTPADRLLPLDDPAANPNAEPRLPLLRESETVGQIELEFANDERSDALHLFRGTTGVSAVTRPPHL